ncbi:WD40 repeat-like protein, partial [Martensiomyces pterosporus]
VSGEVPQDPVLSLKTGRIYERRLLQKYLENSDGKEPNADHTLAENDIVSVHADPPSVKPRPPTLTSIPALLSAFQNEWDSLVLETFTLKQQYQQVRQELSQALYQNDASCRVIARLMKERDEARGTLATLQAQISALETSKSIATSSVNKASGNEDGARMDVDGEEKDSAKRLFKSRVKRKLPANLTPADKWKTATQTTLVESLHTSTKPGIIALDLDSSGDLALTGGLDNHAEVYSRKRDQTLATIKGHTKKVTAALWINGGGLDQQIITASADKSIRIWQPKPANSEEGTDIRSIGWTKLHIIKEHTAEVVGLSVHPCGEYFASAAADGTWAVHSLNGETVISEKVDSPISQIAFHPDGQIIGVGTADGYVKIIDVKQKQVLATLDVASEADSTEVTGLHFSENGYYFATTCASSAAVWDLRKQKRVREWTAADLPSEDGEQSSPFNTVQFDKTGGYLAFSSSRVHLFLVKGWHHLASLPGSSSIQDIAWIGDLSAGLAAASSDNSLHYFSPTE